MRTLEAPFPWFGGKRRVAPIVWQRFGDGVLHYIEPFFGSGAVLLGAPYIPTYETVNDLDGFVANFWRAVVNDAEGVAKWLDWPVNEVDLESRHAWLATHRGLLRRQLGASPDWYDSKIAGFWCWGICQWVGSGWCYGSLKGIPRLSGSQGVHKNVDVYAWFAQLQARLRRVRVTCGDWTRVLTPSALMNHTAVFLDPPYAETVHSGGRLPYANSGSQWKNVEAWCKQVDSSVRVAVCGYEGLFNPPVGWTVHKWKAGGSYRKHSRLSNNATRERIWFSPNCLGE